MKYYNSVDMLSEYIMSEYYLKNPKDNWRLLLGNITLAESVKRLKNLNNSEKEELKSLFTISFYEINQKRLFELLDRAFGKVSIFKQEELEI